MRRRQKETCRHLKEHILKRLTINVKRASVNDPAMPLIPVMP